MDKKNLLSPPLRNALKVLGITVFTVILFFLLVKAAILLLPFALAVVFSQIMEPFIRFIIRKTKLKRSIAALIASVVFFGVVGLIAVLSIVRATNEITLFIKDFPTYLQNLTVLFDDIVKSSEVNLDLIRPDALKMINGLFTSALQSVGQGAKTVTLLVVSGFMSLPKLLVAIVITIMSSVLIMLTREKFIDFCEKQIPDQIIKNSINIKNNLLNALIAYFKAQAKIMIFVFIVLLIGFQFVQTQYIFSLALIVALFDALPFIGAGLFLIPASIANFAFGNIHNGVGFLIIYLVVVALRQTLEPRFVSDQIGIPPLLTLISMYGGLRIAGFPGVLLGPVLVLILQYVLKKFMHDNTLKQYIYKDGE